MEKFCQEQVERIDRLMKIVEASGPYIFHKLIHGWPNKLKRAVPPPGGRR